MSNQLSEVNFKEIQDAYNDSFEMIQVLNPEGKVVDKEAMKLITDEELVQLMKDIVWGRTLDERTILLNRQGALGNYATAGGQEASQLASIAAITKDDFFVPTYRDLGVLVKHGLPMYQAFLWYKGHVVGNQYPEGFNAYIPQVMVGGTLPPAAGVAIGKAFNHSKSVVLAFCGDGATSQGDFYEGINFAGVYKAPLITVIQNNGYGISVPTVKQSATKSLAQKGVGVGVPSVCVDGMDPIAMYLTVKKAREYSIEGNGPVLIEALTYRFGPHTMSDDPKRYRSDEEVEVWRKKDPLTRLRIYLTEKGLWSEEQENEIYEACKQEVKDAMAQMAQVPPQKVSTFLKNMYEVPPQNVQEQIEYYERKEQQ
ncbi:TPA: pyruvate dehydrogenase (acetyl-transferring) E1 component subunit alpha [Staphylococcus delphini]|nr:pyruvate dehydrogenase (acetyl-transferring) E1 component subunit alpha [Staphylococcus delphini]HEC2149323.1 pyruvate dehydrogenase (acetyl-transferring) E1 component subunit alpha [Staphylococcus delphini]HEC2151821.1 pyruvate dehydrogenase (acetyl-transferring) E1 component subunit alpha [Staphylococcus delphini]HEC2161195.1 pyruvate dehydrogenase (acetyl-transferring) E1 component subunit alpha [Staphylococcus delphini]HEC2179009.1 pyruvate dehydrogenase (acetyl-transferring) E1 componen